MKAYLHGEVCVKKITKLPNGLKKINPKDNCYIVADSETTGNHHCIEANEQCKMYENDGVLYLKNDTPVKIFCVDQSRHDTEVLPVGIWEINRANEYDYLSEMTRKVED